MNRVKFINSFSYIFSARPGTPAFDLQNINPIDAKKRLIEFQRNAEKIKTNYRRRLINKTAYVLFENKVKNENKYFGRDEYSNSVIVESNENLIGRIIDTKIIGGNQNTLLGKIITKFNETNYAA